MTLILNNSPFSTIYRITKPCDKWDKTYHPEKPGCSLARDNVTA